MSMDLKEPRRTKELLKSPLHKDMLATMQNNSSKILSCDHHEAKENAKSVFGMPKVILWPYTDVNVNEDNVLFMPRRTEEMLRSSLHRDSRSSSLQPHRTKKSPANQPEMLTTPPPRRTKELLKSWLHMRATMQNNSSKIFFQKPISNVLSEPHRIKEHLLSPLHKDMRPLMVPQASKNIYSEPRRTKELLYAQDQENEAYSVRRKLQFNKQQGDLRFQRILSYLQSAFKSVSTRDLQNLGVQNFIIIMKHLLDSAEVLVVPLNRSNYIEQIFKAMEQLNYPHTITRSALRMPRASPTQVLQLLDFLIEMATKKKEDNQLNVAKVETPNCNCRKNK